MRIRLLLAVVIALFAQGAGALDAPSVMATAKGPNQINLTWAAVANPGYGYKVEILSAGDTRYSSWTDYTATLRNNFGYLPYWVTEGHYLDRADGTGTTTGACNTASSACGTASQLSILGLKYGTAYSFRVRTYAKNDAGTETHSAYSATATATTTTPSVIRHVKQGGTGDGTSEALAWGSLSSASGVTAGTLVIVHGGTLSAASLSPSNSGTQTSRIVFQADPGETVILTAPATRILNLATNYVIVDGFTMQDPSGTSSEVIYVTGTRNIIANTTLDGPAPTSSGYSPSVMGNYNVFENNYWKEYGSMDGANGSQLGIFGDQNVISNVHHEKGGHDTLIVRGNRTLITNNLFGGGWGMGIELQGTGGYLAQYNLVEGNLIREVQTLPEFAPAANKPLIEISSSYNTVRRNVFRTGTQNGIEVSSVITNAIGNYIYNNVIYDADVLGLYQVGTTNSNTIANNIWYKCASSDSSHRTIFYADTWTGSVIRNNQILYYSGGDLPNFATVERNRAGAVTVAYAVANYTEFPSNVTTTPLFIDEAAFDFHLKSTSGLRSIGVSVTDPNWGPTGETDIGAFKFFSDESALPVVTNITCSPVSIQAPGVTNCSVTSSNATSFLWEFSPCQATCSTLETGSPATIACAIGGFCRPCVTPIGPGGTGVQFCTLSDYLKVRYIKPSDFGAY